MKLVDDQRWVVKPHENGPSAIVYPRQSLRHEPVKHDWQNALRYANEIHHLERLIDLAKKAAVSNDAAIRSEAELLLADLIPPSLP